VTQATPRWFGVAPATVLLAIAGVAFVLGVVMVVAGSIVLALLLLGIAALLTAAVLEVARRKPDTLAVQRAARAADSLRARVAFAAHATRAPSDARREIARRRAEALRLDTERERLMRAFGEAAYRGEEAMQLRAEIDALETRRAALAAEAAQIAAAAAAEVERASRAMQPTEVRQPDNS
jgi:ABC-type multidrug transport system fused ATPase/permease subunit